MPAAEPSAKTREASETRALTIPSTLPQSRLDRFRPGPYATSVSHRSKLAAFAMLGLGLFPSSANAITVHGALIIDGADKVETDRFRVPKDKDWEKTIRYYR